MFFILCADAASSSSSISLHWQKPEQDNGSAVTSYLVESASTPAGRLAPTYHKAYNGTNTNCTVSLKTLLCLHHLPALPVGVVRAALWLQEVHEMSGMPAPALLGAQRLLFGFRFLTHNNSPCRKATYACLPAKLMLVLVAMCAYHDFINLTPTRPGCHQAVIS